jgi:hypothetical protein
LETRSGLRLIGISSTNQNLATTSFAYDALYRTTQVIEAFGVTGPR